MADTALDNRVSVIEKRLDHLATKTDIEALKTLIATREASMLRWLVGILLASSLAVGLALVRTFMG